MLCVQHQRASSWFQDQLNLLTNVVKIFNPSRDNVAFTVSIKGDEEWIGSRKASMGRTTYLPANSSLMVTNLYWTTPRMTNQD